MDLAAIAEDRYGKPVKDCTNKELYFALLQMTKEMAKQAQRNRGKKKLYYISAEFLIGKLLSNNLINLGIYEEVRELLEENGKSLAEIEEEEPEPSLGNGGLGRLAACFLDSVATLGLNGAGVGLNYHYGLFRQVFQNRLQHELPNPWIEKESWLKRTDTVYEIPFPGFCLKSRMYDIDVTGYGGRAIKLHLFDVETADESVVKDGGISFDKEDIAKNLTLFLYPDDSDEQGRMLRIYQQYFMVSSAAQLILDEAAERGSNLHDLAEYVVIQINDTHPTMIIPELIRLLVERGILTDEAVRIVSKICAYTNHTILAEALETWPLSYLKKAVPSLVPIIHELDNRAKLACKDPSLAVIDDKKGVHMAHIDIHYGFSVNGVARLHTEILKHSELKNFYRIYPEKFNNKTNGITFRRWLLHCNPRLSALIGELIGTGYRKDAAQLEKLEAFRDDPAVLDRLREIKLQCKTDFKNYLKQTQGIELDEHSVFDVQAKRLHEYKRQQLHALYIIHKYFEIKSGKKPKTPITVIFGAKAAPAYVIAKDVIHLILCLQELTCGDPEVSPYLKVVMTENYNVSLAEKLIPAADIHEQISLASKEASGTGNMKFMLNGAVALGTMDGANVEIAELAGKGNIYIFGESSETVIRHYEKADYRARTFYEKDPDIRRAADFLVSDKMLSIGSEEHLRRLHDEILNKDWFMTLLDFRSYLEVKEQALEAYEDGREWARKMLANISKAGYFSSDRAIAQYNEDIWKL